MSVLSVFMPVIEVKVSLSRHCILVQIPGLYLLYSKYECGVL